MKSTFASVFVFILLLTGASCQKKVADNTTLANPDIMHTSVRKLTDVMVHDIFSPPVASRIYAYANIAAYEALVPGYPDYQSLTGQLTNLKNLPKPTPGQEYCYPLASLRAFLTVGRTLTFSGDKIDEFEPQVYQKYKDSGLDEEVYNRSMAYGEVVGKKIIEWANQDGYRETRGHRYTVSADAGKWQPTPPAYMDAVEPFWFKIRPFVLDSCSQFKPDAPSKFSTDKNSEFYKEVLQVYETGKSLTEEQKAIASFWDCNPFVMHNTGHVMYATKKISPGGHWINIAAVASKKAKANFMKTVEAYALISVAIADGFISCWDEKYRSGRIRPETVINTHIDKDWAPLLQTPPFPEYPSGHSVISTAAAIALTSLYGDNFAYSDSTEVVFGLAPRNFKSFKQAAEEAAISRLYGGIHYLPAITNGQTEGQQVGAFIINKLKTRKSGKPVTEIAQVK